MDVRLVTESEVQERGIDELQKLLKGEDGFVCSGFTRWP